MGDKKRGRTGKKRRFKGNQHTATNTQVESPIIDSQEPGPSGERSSKNTVPDTPVDDRNGLFLLLDSSILSSFLSRSMRCPECATFSVSCCVDSSSKYGFCHDLEFVCSNCTWKEVIKTSKEVSQVGTDSSRKKDMEINVRMVSFARSLGKQSEEMLRAADNRRSKDASRMSLETKKKRRKTLRAVRKGFQDTTKEKEGDDYNPGGH